MNRNASLRIATFLAAPVVVAGIVAGGGALNHPHPVYLADFGANETAEIAQQHARDEGIQHMPDTRHAPERPRVAVPGQEGQE
jgi:hypothetical protein